MAIAERRSAREAVLRALYEVEIGGSTPESALTNACEQAPLSLELEVFAMELGLGVLNNLAKIDGLLEPLIPDYSYSRLAAVDRNMLRIAAFELFYMESIPPAVTIDEAVDIARKYSMVESAKFVNGVLGQLLLISPKAHWDASKVLSDLVEKSEPSAPFQPEIEEVEEPLEANSEKAKMLTKLSGWVIKTESDSHAEVP